MVPTRNTLSIGLLAGLALTLAGAVAPGIAWAQSGDPSFRVTNNAAGTINEIYVSSAANNDWGPDRLGERSLGSGATTMVRLPAGQCVNDVRIVYASGETTERRRVDTCKLTDMVFP